MRIMEMVSGRSVNGAASHCVELSRVLAARGHNVTLVCRPGAWAAQQSLPAGVEVVESEMYPFHSRDVREITELARARAIDVVHTHQSRSNFFGVVLRRNLQCPVVATAHNRLLQLHWMWNDHVIAATEATRQFQRRYNFCANDRLSVVRCFVDSERFAGVPRSAGQDARRALGIDANAFLIGAIGNICRRKGLNYLIQALPEIATQHPDVRVLVVGKEIEPSFAHHCRRLAQRCGVAERLIWAGHHNDIPQLLQSLDLFVLPSLEEQLPIAILEAMASGLPIVATAVGGVAEGVRHGESGLLVPPGNSRPLAEAIGSLIRDSELRQRLGTAARQRVQQDFSPAIQCQRIEEVFQRAIARRKSELRSGWSGWLGRAVHAQL